MRVLPSALKHRVFGDDIEHALRNAVAVDDLDDELRLYLGPARDGSMLEIIAVVRERRPDLVIHAMTMRTKFERLLPGSP